MSLPIPTPATLAQRFATVLAQQTFVASDGSLVTLDATAPATLESALAILSGLSNYEVYLFARDEIREMMVTTATLNGRLPDHGKMWGVPRRSAAAGIGNVLVSVSADVTLPIGTAVVTDGTVQWLVTTATTIAAGTTGTVPVKASSTGTAGNLAAGTSLTLVSPVAGVTAIVVDTQGLAGGAAIEAVESWRARIIDRIRTPRGGGTAAEYRQWAKDAGAAYVNVVPGWAGFGTVGVIISMPGPVAPTDAQIASVQAYIDSVRPVRGNVSVVAAQIVARNPVIRLSPDTLAARSKIITDMQAFYPEQGIGGTLYAEAITQVIVTDNGVQNALITPAADEALAQNEQAVLGTITWGETS